MSNIKIHPKHVDFGQKIKELHKDMCNEIAFVMAATGTKELDLLGTDASHTIILMEDKFTGETSEVEVEKVILHGGDLSHVSFGEVAVTTVDGNYIDDEINILHNQYVIPCSVRDLYETVFEECAIKRGDK